MSTRACPGGPSGLHSVRPNGTCVYCSARFEIKAAEPEKTTDFVVCAQEGGSRCSICHYQFADGDDICNGAGHQIGQSYQVGR